MTLAQPSAAARRSAGAVLLAPLWIELLALRGGAPHARIVRTGMGADGAAATGGAAVVAGFGGALTRELSPGDVVVATEVIGPDGHRLACDGAGELEASLRAAGLRARSGPVVTTRRIVRGRERDRLSQAVGALAADLESFWLARAAGRRPFAVARVIVDTPGRELMNPIATLTGGLVAFRVLRRAARPLAGWQVACEEPCPSQ